MFRNIASNTVFIAILLNIVLPMIVSPFANAEQIKPSMGAENLNFFDQIIHMLVHHNQVPITSSLIIALIVGLSIYGAFFIYKIKTNKTQSHEKYAVYQKGDKYPHKDKVECPYLQSENNK